jgi:hypothetical protein
MLLLAQAVPGFIDQEGTICQHIWAEQQPCLCLYHDFMVGGA